MRRIFCVIFMLWPLGVLAQDWEDRHLFENAQSVKTLRILSSTDTSFFAPIVEDFLQGNPDLNVEYLVTGTAQIDPVFRANPTGFDVVISSAMDLQLKLVNDGYAQALNDLDHPEWAQWRHSLFAFTTEPATIVLNRRAFEGYDIPQTRQELIAALRARPEVFRNRLGTYDVRQSGLGYLFATQDARASETFWRLMEVMGSLNTRLYCCSGEMIDDLSSGEILVAYNVLGSYVSAREDIDELAIVLPSDFPTTMMRTGLVSAQAAHPAEAAAFIAHLVKVQTGNTTADVFPLPPLSTNNDGGARTVIALEPALMTYLDQLKRRTFLKEWSDAMIQ